jgi:hypothetical protein
MHPEFDKKGYLVARNFFDDTTIALTQTYFDFKYRYINYSEENRREANKVKLDPTGRDGDIASSFTFYGDLLTESIHLNYGQKTCELLGADLSPTYSYARIYEKGDVLVPHFDREACEISATCPILVSSNIPSTIYISNYKVDSNIDKKTYTLEEVERRGDYTEVSLHAGDALFYKGRERFHWRKPLECDYLSQFFMHFVKTDGVYKDWTFDKRPYSGFPKSYNAFGMNRLNK